MNNDPKVHIGLFVPDISTTGGVERVVCTLANTFVQQYGWQVSILSCTGTHVRPAYPLHPDVHLANLHCPAYPSPAIARIRWYLALLKPLKNHLLAHRVDVLLGCGGYLSTCLALLAPLQGIRLVGFEHISHRFSVGPQRLLRRVLYKRLDALVVLTKHDESYYSTFIRHVCHIPNPNPYVSERPINYGATTILAAGRLTRQKGFDLLIQAFKTVHQRHSQWNLVIYGDGKEREELQRQINACQLEDVVTLPGEVTDLYSKLHEGSIFVLSSRFEGFGMVLVEAMSAGLACVSFGCPGPDELIQHGVCGLLVPPLDVQQLAGSICRLIESPGQAASLGRQAREASKAYRPEHIGKKWKHFIDGILTTKGNNKA